MKKFLPYILILTIVVQLFAPFTIGSGVKNNLGVEINKAEAIEFDETEQGFKKAFIETENGPTESNLVLTNQMTKENTVSVYFIATLDTGYPLQEDAANIYRHINGFSQGKKEDNALILVVKEENQITGIVDITDTFVQNYKNLPSKITIQGININTNTNPDILAPEKEYSVTFYYQATNSGRGWGESIPNLSNDKDYYPIVTTNIQIGPVGTTTGSAQYVTKKNINEATIEDPLDCSWRNFKGCVAWFPYTLIFRPTSAIFSISGMIFDFAFGYSVQDNSYRSTFVVEGWGIVRDFCNMFFIFILLYIAFGTILNLHSVKTKEMIINVVIIGLLINFSLFATHLIIDASNILARVFYNSETIKIVQKNADGSLKEVDTGEYLKLSEAIVSKINPQELILKAGMVGNIPDKGGMSEEVGAGEISLGTLVLVILLASIVNIVGIIVFISVALIFIGRVIGLWLAMIFVPFTFFTYTVPSLQDLEMVGWKKWWPETIKMAFLAPVFMFFMYLIVKFLNLKLDLISTAGKSSIDLVVAILLPFAFIMILLWKAKDIAKKMSGTMGQSITNSIAALGGMALGGAALGGASLLRGAGNLYGQIANSKASQNRFDHKIEFNKKLEKWEDDKKKGIAVGPRPEWGNYIAGVKAGGGTVNTWNPIARMGTALNMAQRKANKVDEARHHTDADIKAAGFEGMKWENMSAEQRNIVREKVKKENYTKFTDETEKKYRQDNGLDTVDPTTGKLPDLNSDQKEEIKNLAKSKAVDKFEEEINKATKGVNAFTRVFSKTNTGSYDIRKLSTINVDKNASIFTKIPVELIAGVATGVRSGILKSAGLSNGGIKVEGKFFDDLKSVLKDSLKNIKVELPESHDHGGGKKVGHGDSGGHH